MAYGKSFYQAGSEASSRRGFQGYYDVRNKQRNQKFASLSQLLGIGNTLWETYSGNKGLIKHAESRGLKTTSSMFAQIFGTPEFETKGGLKVSGDRVNASIIFEDYEKSIGIGSLDWRNE